MTIIHDIEAAKVLLERAENEADPAIKSQLILDAIEQLDDCSSENASPSERTLIANLRVSHTRRLLTQLTTFESVSMDAWLSCNALLIFFLKDEVDLVLNENSELKKDFKAFLQLRRREFLESLGQK
jgi:hypothetical protein